MISATRIVVSSVILEQRLQMQLGSDGTDWWVDEVPTRDGYRFLGGVGTTPADPSSARRCVKRTKAM